MLAASIAVALMVWGAPAPLCPVHVAELGPNRSPDTPLGMYLKRADGSCEILVDARAWPFWKLCAVLVHETGHAAGYRDPVGYVDPETGRPDYWHSPDPESVMFPFLLRRAEACIGKRPPMFRRGQFIHLSP